MKIFTCHVCESPLPEDVAQEHHTRPQATGGKKGDTVHLCGSCHDNLHRFSEMILHGKGGKALDLARIVYKGKAIQRILDLAKMVAEWFQAKQDGFVEEDEEIPVVFTLPIREKVALQTLANEIKVDGKKGMNHYVRKLVLNHLYERFPLLKVKNDKH